MKPAAVAGYAVGVLHLETRHPLMPGNVQNARSFPAPVLYEAVPLEDPWPMMRGDPALTDQVVAAAGRLADRNVGVIVGACGSFAHYQKAVAETAPVPVFLSIMTQAPLLLGGLGPRRKLGVLCAALSALTPDALGQCGIEDPSRLAIRELRGGPQFDRILNGETSFEAQVLEAEVVEAARRLVTDDPAVGAILFQCSDLPPFGAAVNAATGLPVFDMTLMIRWLQSAVEYPRYT